ncbi:MAG: pimeloyl-ACP methyl ester carboxylesterase [Glaciecola sp.]|jgi:pimeloyl-ACP methyl ester carboxylesterase|uniref:lipase family alpha/beta hydrolase n=2 Tax=Congregibacter sp. TaxID=2744308 RepID=UPI0039E27CBC
MGVSRMALFGDVVMPGADSVDPHYLPPPAAWLALTEPQRVALEVVSLASVRRLLNNLAPGDGHPVMVLPGFLGSDAYNASLRRFLSGLGYKVHGWGQGRNLGPRGNALESLMERVAMLSERYGEPLSLVGHSLGGIFARELAREEPARVRQVITLGSPFGRGRHSASYPARLFEALNPTDDLPVALDDLHRAPPVPTTAVYSKGDGIVNWRTAFQNLDFAHGSTQNIQVRGSHCGMTFNPTVRYVIADRLRQAMDDWQPFSVSGWAKVLVPKYG